MNRLITFWWRKPGFATDVALRWRHNGHDGVSNHQPHHCLLNRLFGCRSNKTSKPRVTGLCAGNSPGTGEFPAQMASNAENVSYEIMFPFDDVIMDYSHNSACKHTHYRNITSDLQIPAIWMFAILAWTGTELSRGQASDWHTDRQTHTHTDAGNDNTRRPKLASGKNEYVFKV